MRGIRGDLSRRLIAGLTVVLLVAGAGLYFLCRRTLTAQFDRGLEDKARMIGALLEDESDEGIDDDLPAVDGSARDPGERYEIWIGDSPTPLRRSPSLGEADLPRLAGGRADLTLPGGESGRALWLQAPIRARPRGPQAKVVVARPRRPLDQALDAVLSALIAVGALLLAGVSLLVWREVGRGLAPLARVADQAARIDASLLDRRFPTDGLPAELLPICSRLNDLLDRLSASFDRERRFSADVAHELRTPLAELRNIAEVAMQFPGARDPLPDLLSAALQMERLVTALLALARAEGGRQTAARQPIDLGRLAEEVWAPFATQAAERNLRVTTRVASVVSATDVVLISAIFGNLFANAVDYTPAGGAVEWELNSAGGLEVVNDNASLSPADLPHVFERFWRKDAARTDGRHGGLGLSLARSFARVLGATLTLELRQGNRVHARFSQPERA